MSFDKLREQGQLYARRCELSDGDDQGVCCFDRNYFETVAGFASEIVATEIVTQGSTPATKVGDQTIR